MEVITAILAVCVIFFIVKWIHQNRGLPPGPHGLIPGVKGLRLMASGMPPITFRTLRKKYGDIFSIRAGTRLLVILNGYDVIREALVKRADEFSDRPNTFVNDALVKGRGIIASSGEHWKKTRTFALTTLREFGFGKRSLEERIVEEVDVFLDVVGRTNGQPFDISHDVHVSVSNIICSIVFGKRFEHDDTEFAWLLSRLDFERTAATGVLATLPALRFLPGDMFGFDMFMKKLREAIHYFHTSVEKHKETFDANSPRDFIDAFIQEKSKHENDSRVFREDNLEYSILHLFAAGTETTSTTIRWIILYLLRNPDVQARMYEEVESVVGLSRPPTIADRRNMPYCDAVITEVLRISNIVPLSLPHGARRDINFNGYRIPTGATIIANLDSILRDPDIFANPDQFKPSRFIDKDGKFAGAEKVVAFSLGRRVCLGEALARMELYLFLTSLVQRFQFLPENANKVPTEEGIFGITYGPKPYKFRAVHRS